MINNNKIHLSVLDSCQANIMLLDPQFQIVFVSKQLGKKIASAGEVIGHFFPEKFSQASSHFNADSVKETRFSFDWNDQDYEIDMVPVYADSQLEGFSLLWNSVNRQSVFKEQIDRLCEALETGAIANLHIDTINDPYFDGLASQLTSSIGELVAPLNKVSEELRILSECDFNVDAQEGLQGIFAEIDNNLITTVSNLTEAIRQTVEFAQVISETATDIAARNEELASRTKEQAASLQSSSASMEELSTTVANNTESAHEARKLATQLSVQAQEGRQAIRRVSESMEHIDSSSQKIEGIIGIINEIAFQTNILSLNAAVEAARAGEEGQGFAVVATEVRALAKRSAGAAKEIKDLIKSSSQIVDEGQLLAEKAEQQIDKIAKGAAQTNELVDAISTASSEQNEGIRLANESINLLDSITQENQSLVEELAGSTRTLDQLSGFLSDAVNLFKLAPPEKETHPLHGQVRELAKNAASEIESSFTRAVKSRVISEDAIFDRDYREIDGTNPKKFTTQYDSFADRVLPDIQERILNMNPQVVYAIAIDNEGYVPTHNKAFCKPLTGNYESDLAGNRTKRLFSDRVGQVCGSHEQPFKLQTYRRDTGELMFDLSVPVYLFGKHWGGFRVGYRIG